MPYINIDLSRTITPEKKDAVRTKIGELITLLPGKTADVVIITFSDGKTMYFRGQEQENCAYVDVRLNGTCGFEIKQNFTKAMFTMFAETLDIDSELMYLTILEYTTWGIRGTLK